MEATCAKCGILKPLCHSPKIDGIQQPRICKECLLESMQTGDYTINDAYWITQLYEAGDKESIARLAQKEG